MKLFIVITGGKMPLHTSWLCTATILKSKCVCVWEMGEGVPNAQIIISSEPVATKAISPKIILIK